MMLAQCFAAPLARFIAAHPAAQGFNLEMERDGLYETLVVDAVMSSGAVKTKCIREKRDGRAEQV